MQRIERVESLLEKVVRYSVLYRDEHLDIDVIVNPCAGSLSSEARCDRIIERAGSKNNPVVLDREEMRRILLERI